MLLGAASLLLSPLIAQQAAAKQIPSSSTDSAASSFTGFDGVGGADADYANAEVGLELWPFHLPFHRIHSMSTLLTNLLDYLTKLLL